MSGTIESIHLAREVGGPVFPVDHATAVVELGLEGDRLVSKAREGGKTVAAHRQVTLIEAEALEALHRDHDVEMSAADSRRNICTRGAALNHLVDRTFTIGEATLRGVELCEPCGTLERMVGKKGVIKGLIHRGGLRAEVIVGGRIGVGDALAVK